MGRTKATRDQTLAALHATKRAARTTAGHLRSLGRTRQAEAYEDVAAFLEFTAGWMRSSGEGLPVTEQLFGNDF